MPKKQLAVYLRLSLEDTGANDESNSITAQRGIIAQFIQGQPELASMKTVEFVDDGYSAFTITLDIISHLTSLQLRIVHIQLFG